MTYDITNVKITGKAHWWGFELDLNEDAVGLLGDIESLAEDIIEAIGEEIEPIADLISFYLKLRQAIIQAVDKGTGVRLVSPWIAPTLLIPLPLKDHVNDTMLRYTIFDPEGNNWGPEQKLAKHYGSDSPSLVQYQDKLYAFHRGANDDAQIWHMEFDPNGDGWGPDQVHEYCFTSNTPAVAVYNGLLYLVARGTDSELWWMTFDGTSWSGYQKMGEHYYTSDDPALAVYNNELYCICKGNGDDAHFWVTKFNGSNWGGYSQIQGSRFSRYGPALAVYEGYLYLVAKGNGDDNKIWWMRFDGQNWSGYQNLGEHVFTADTPSLVVFEGYLYCITRGNRDDENLWWTRFNGSSWGGYTQATGQKSANHPASIFYQDENSQKKHIMCVYRGVQY